MNSDDLMSFNNERAHVIKGLIAYCTEHDLSYNYTEQRFTVTLPYLEPTPTEVDQNKAATGSKKRFNIDTWGPKGYVEGEEPDPEQPLTEGEPPEPQL